MPVKRANAPIPLGVSLDEGTASPLVQAGAIEVSQNLWLEKRGQARPRPVWMSRTAIATPVAPMIVRRGYQMFDGTDCYYYSAVEAASHKTTCFYARVTDRIDLPVVGIDVSSMPVVNGYESAVCNGAVYSVCAVQDGAGTSALYVVRKDLTTGQVAIAIERKDGVSTFMPRAQVHVVDGHVLIVALADALDGSVVQVWDSATLYVWEVDQTTMVLTQRLALDVAPAFNTTTKYHAWIWESDSTKAYLHIAVPDSVYDGSIHARIRLVVLDATSGTWANAWSKVGTVAGIPNQFWVEAFAAIPESVGNLYVLAAGAATADGVYSWHSSPLSIDVTPVGVYTRPTGQLGAVCAGAVTGGAYFAIAFVVTNGVVFMRYGQNAADAGACVGSNASAISRPFGSGVSTDLVLLYRAQSSAILCELRWVYPSERGADSGVPRPVGRCATYLTSSSVKSTRPFVDVANGQAWLTVAVVASTTEKGTTQNASVFCFDIALQSNGISEAIAQITDSLVFGDGLVSSHDGYAYSECGFCDAPKIKGITGNGTSGVRVTPTYQAIYERVDARGILHRSAPSASYVATVDNDTTTLTATISAPLTAHWTAADPGTITYVRLFRADTAGTFRSVGAFTLLPQVSVAAPCTVISIPDTPNAEPTGERAYWTGGVFGDGCWPAPQVVARHSDRIWCVSSEYRDQIWASKVIEYGVAPATDPTLLVRVPGAVIHGLGSLDQHLVVLSSQGVHVVVGDGVNNAGAGVPWDITRIAGAPPCVGGPCVVTPRGIIYRAESGLWMIGRDLSAEMISQPIEASLGSYDLLGGAWVETLKACLLVTTRYLFALSDAGEWSVWTPGAMDGSPILQVYVGPSGEAVALDAAAALWYLEPKGNGCKLTVIRTPWLHVTGWDGFGRARSLHLRGACDALVNTSSHADVVAVGAANITLTGPQTIDAVAVVAGQRVLLTAQTVGSQNGIWVCAAGAWTRPVDYAAGGHAEDAYVACSGGHDYAGTTWICTTTAPFDVIGTNDTAWSQVANTVGLTIAARFDRETSATSTTNVNLDELVAAQSAGKIAIEWRLPRQKCSSVQFEITTLRPQIRWETASIEFGQRAGTAKLSAGRV